MYSFDIKHGLLNGALDIPDIFLHINFLIEKKRNQLGILERNLEGWASGAGEIGKMNRFYWDQGKESPEKKDQKKVKQNREKEKQRRKEKPHYEKER